jgi:voltage-gated potassium channel
MPLTIRRTEVLIAALAVLSIVLVVWGNILVAKGQFPVGVYTIDVLICGVFAWDYVSRMTRSPSRAQFLKSNWYEPLAMVPAVVLDLMIGLPILSAGLRTIRLVRFVRVVLVAARLKRSLAVSGHFVARSQLLYLAVVAGSAVLTAAFAVLAIEFREPGAQIQTISEALWWSLSTVTTVGYGDVVPSTPVGRIIGMVLRLVGIGIMAALISQVTATIVESRLVHTRSPRGEVPSMTVARLQTMVGRVSDLSDVELAALLREIVELNGQVQPTEAEPDST